MYRFSAEMTACIENCLACYTVCLGTATTHCLEAGGAHVEPAHYRLMLACAEICRSAAHMMLTAAPQHRLTCKACAEICEACARSCEDIGEMEDCVEACRRCAETCREMAA